MASSALIFPFRSTIRRSAFFFPKPGALQRVFTSPERIATRISDGVSVDVQPRVYHGRDYEPYAITESWEVVPERPVTASSCSSFT